MQIALHAEIKRKQIPMLFIIKLWITQSVKNNDTQ